MTRRADPERIYLARRAATFAILTQTRAIDELDAEHWIARWEREAERQGLDRLSADFWATGRDWIGGEPPEACPSAYGATHVMNAKSSVGRRTPFTTA